MTPAISAAPGMFPVEAQVAQRCRACGQAIRSYPQWFEEPCPMGLFPRRIGHELTEREFTWLPQRSARFWEVGA